MTQFRNIMTILIVALSAAIITGITYTQDAAVIRFVHVDDGSPTLDIVLNGDLAAADLRYGDTTAPVEVPAGPADLSTFLAGTGVKIYDQRITLESGPAAIILAEANRGSLHIVSEDLASVALGDTRLAFFNALEAEALFSITMPDRSVATETLVAGMVSSPVESSAGAHEIAINAADDVSFGPVSEPLAAGAFNLLVIHGATTEPELLNAATALEGVQDSGRVRFIHAIEGAAPVDLSVNGKLIVPGLGFAAPSTPVTLPAGSLEIAVNLGAAEIMSERMQLRAGEMSTVVLMRTSAGLGLFAFADNTDAVDADSAVVGLINAIPDSVINYLQLESGAIIALNVQANEAGATAKIVPGRQAMTTRLNIGGNQGEVTAPPHTFYGGSFYRLVALAGGIFSAPRLLIVETSLQRRISSPPSSEDVAADDMPSAEAVEVPDEADADQPAAIPASQPETDEPDAEQLAEAERETPATEEVVDSAAQDDSHSDAPTPPEPSLTPYATVNVNPDAALHMRQYPTSDALSLGLLPANSNLMIIGRRGPSQFDGEPNPLPVDLGDFSDPAAALLPYQDLRAAETWLYAMYSTPDSGALYGWVNAMYLEVFDQNGAEQRLASLAHVRQNQPGSAYNTDIAPPELADRVAARVVGIQGGAMLNLRRNNDATSEVLSHLPPHQMLSLIGLDSEEAWAFVEYRPEIGNPVRGWVSMAYTQLLLNGEPVQAATLRTLDPTTVPQISGIVTGGVQPVDAAEPVAPMEGIVGEVNVNFDSALHLRRYPDATSESLALIPPDTFLQLEGVTESAGWYKVQYEGETGWVAAPYLVLSMNGRKYARTFLEGQLPRFNDLGF